MNILFVNFNTGAGIEFIGNLFIDILKRINGIANIVEYKSQCCQTITKLDVNAFDVLILNDFKFDDENNKKSKILEFKGPIINICHSFNPAVIAKHGEYSIVINKEINNIDRIYSLNFISGNIWNYYNKFHNRPNDLLYISRLIEDKIIQEFIDHLRQLNLTVDFYGPLIDEKYYKNNSDVITYKGYVNHADLNKIYNSYKRCCLFSRTECLSMTIREALLCGIKPIVYDKNNFTEYISDHIHKITDLSNIELPVASPISGEEYTIIKSKLSFDDMIIQFINILNDILSMKLEYDKKSIYKKNILRMYSHIDESYTSDTVDWQKINI